MYIPTLHPSSPDVGLRLSLSPWAKTPPIDFSIEKSVFPVPSAAVQKERRAPARKQLGRSESVSCFKFPRPDCDKTLLCTQESEGGDPSQKSLGTSFEEDYQLPAKTMPLHMRAMRSRLPQKNLQGKGVSLIPPVTSKAPLCKFQWGGAKKPSQKRPLPAISHPHGGGLGEFLKSVPDKTDVGFHPLNVSQWWGRSYKKLPKKQAAQPGFSHLAANSLLRSTLQMKPQISLKVKKMRTKPQVALFPRGFPPYRRTVEYNLFRNVRKYAFRRSASNCV